MNKYGTFWRRFWAGWVDSFVFLPVYIVNIHVMNCASSMPVIFFALWYVTMSFLWYGYSICLHGKYGQTLGKMALKVKVLDVSESRQIGFKQAIMRDAPPLILTIALLPHDLNQIFNGTSYMLHKGAMPDKVSIVLGFIAVGWGLLEVITMLSNSKRRAIHDFIAKSVVVRI
ncbi:MAG: RDD family protein [Lentisphaerae bacterium]|nr:RDD family protein [Lentisphaerota bacterium]